MAVDRVAFALCVAIMTMAGCSTGSSQSGQPSYPETITFDGETLTKATSWDRQGMSGVVYLRHGDQLPNAALQVGAIISSRHPSAQLLHAWTDQQFYSSGGHVFHEAGSDEDSCKVGGDPRRAFVTLDVCKTGVARSACVQTDETIEVELLERCINKYDCFQTVCDQRWLQRRESLDLLAADILTIR